MKATCALLSEFACITWIVTRWPNSLLFFFVCLFVCLFFFGGGGGVPNKHLIWGTLYLGDANS